MSVFVLDVNAQWNTRNGKHRTSEQQPSADDIIAKMKEEVNLTKQQADAIKPIIENSIIKRQQLIQDLKKERVTDKDIIQNTMEQFEKIENQKLSQVLTKDQIDKWNSYQNFHKMFNQQADDTQGQMGKGHRRGRRGGMSQSAAFGM